MTEDEARHFHESVFREEQMAEAALVAIAEPLQWADFESGAALARLPGSYHYGVVGRLYPHGIEWVAEFGKRGKISSVAGFTTSMAAKAACERHYATGKWD